MHVINGILFYSEKEIENMPKGKTFDDFVPKRRYYDVRKIEDSFMEEDIIIQTNQGKKEIHKKYENAAGLNREQRRAREHNKRRKGTDLAAFHKKVKKRRKTPVSKSKLFTPKQFINILYNEEGMKKTDIRKHYDACRIATGSRLSYNTFCRYITEVRK